MENINDKHILNFQKARNWLFIMIITTLASCVLFAAGFVFRVPFSATLPIDLLYSAGEFAIYYADETYWLIGIIVAFFTIFMYLLFWVLSKKRRALIVFALTFFIIDSVFLVNRLLATISEANPVTVVLMIGLHGWILFCLAKGAIAWAKLKGITDEQFIKDVLRLAKESKNQAKN